MDSSNNEYLINDVLKPGFPQAKNVKILENSTGGDQQHFTSDIIHLTVEYEQDEKLQRKRLVIKLQKTGPFRSFFSKLKLYDKEIRMYEQMIPYIDNCLDKRIVPVHYHTTDTGILILEDLIERDFKCVKRREYLSVEQSYPILEALAKFHAAFYKVSEQNPQLLNDSLFKNCMIIDTRRKSIDRWEPVVCEHFKRSNAVHLISPFTRMASYMRQDENTADLYAKMSHRNFKFVVLNHGDFRKENVLLKYDSEARVLDVQIIDLQGCWWTSPICDFFTYLIFSVDITDVERQFDDLLDCYINYLNKTLTKFQCSQRYEKSDFYADLKKVHFFLLLCLLLQCTMACPHDVTKSLDTFLFENKEKQISYMACLDDDRFRHNLCGWLKFYERLGVFQDWVNDNEASNITTP